MKEYKEFELPVSDRNPLRKKVICGTCGYAMSLSNTKNAKYHCRTSHLETQFDCTSEGILQADINEMVVDGTGLIQGKSKMDTLIALTASLGQEITATLIQSISTTKGNVQKVNWYLYEV